MLKIYGMGILQEVFFNTFGVVGKIFFRFNSQKSLWVERRRGANKDSSVHVSVSGSVHADPTRSTSDRRDFYKPFL
jgi:hypothetical protein